MIRATAIALIIGVTQVTYPMDRQRLDACERYLGNGYERCRACAFGSVCNVEWSTRRCNLPWDESYGAFIDRRIEESAAPGMPYVFTGLKRLKGSYQMAAGR